MDIKTLELSALHFPSKEWRWVRASAPFDAASPDSFVWAAEVEGKLWAWHPKGGDLSNGSPALKVRALVLKCASELEAFGLYLKTTFTAQTALDCEWTNALIVLRDHFKYDAAASGLPAFWSSALEACGLSPHLGVLAQRQRFTFLSERELSLLYRRRWDPSTLELLETFPSDVRPALIDAFEKWNVSAGHARECCNLALILTKKLGSKAALTTLAGQYKSAEEFRLSLLRIAQPELYKMGQARIDKLRNLHLPQRTTVFGDPTFESDQLKLTHNPRNFADFENFKSWMNDPETDEKIRDLLEIYQ